MVEDNCVQEAFKIVEKALAETPPFLLIDFAVFRRSSRNDFLEIERHGKVAIAFDKANLIVPPHLDTNKHFSQMQVRFNQIKIHFDLLQPLVKKVGARQCRVRGRNHGQSSVVSLRESWTRK